MKLTRAMLAASVASLSGSLVSYAALAEPLQIEEVVVQAQRVSESQQTVPVAVSAVSEETLKALTVTSVDDIQRAVPSLQISPDNTGASTFKIRGSFSEQFTDPGVVTYVDEVPVDPRVLGYSLFDMESVEQLKGPQGTLFGKNTTGGAVLFFTHQPDDTQSGYVRLRAGNYNERAVEGAINVPLTDTLALRLAGKKETRDGFVDSVNEPGKDYDNRDNESLRLSALWNPSETVENFTQISHFNVDQQQPNTFVKGPASGGLAGILQPYIDQQEALGHDKTISDFNFAQEVEFSGISNITTVDFEGFSVKNIIHYSETDQFFGKDFGGMPKNIDLYQIFIDGDQNTFYDELQFFGEALDSALDWRVGMTYAADEQEQQFNGSVFTFIGAGLPFVSDVTNKSKSKAVFAQSSYHWNDLTFTAGWRKTWDSRQQIKNDYWILSSDPQTLACRLEATSPAVDFGNCLLSLEEDFSDYNYNVNVTWQATDDVMTYLATRRGYKSGGFNPAAPSTALTSYQPEVIEDIEWGLKADWLVGNMPVRTNLAVYTAAYDGIQISSRAVVGTELKEFIQNSSYKGKSNEATFDGFELEVIVKPAEWLELSMFYAQVNTQFDNYVQLLDNNGTPDYSDDTVESFNGRPVGGVVPRSSGITAAIDLPTPSQWGDIRFVANYYAADAAETTDDSTIRPRQDQVNLRLSWDEIFGSAAGVALYGKNVTDNLYCTETNLGLGASYEICGAPAQWGVEFAYQFGQ